MDALNSLKKTFTAFAREEDGAQVVEYALVIALVSISLALALKTAFSGTPSAFASFVTRVTNCLTGASCTASP